MYKGLREVKSSLLSRLTTSEVECCALHEQLSAQENSESDCMELRASVSSWQSRYAKAEVRALMEALKWRLKQEEWEVKVEVRAQREALK